MLGVHGRPSCWVRRGPTTNGGQLYHNRMAETSTRPKFPVTADRHTSHATAPRSMTKGATQARDRVAGGSSSSRSVWSICLRGLRPRRRRQDFWFQVHLPFVQAVGAPQGEVDEIGPGDPRARAEGGAGAIATCGTSERLRRVEWFGTVARVLARNGTPARKPHAGRRKFCRVGGVGAIRCTVHRPRSFQERDRVCAWTQWSNGRTKRLPAWISVIPWQFAAGQGARVKSQSRKVEKTVSGITFRRGAFR